MTAIIEIRYKARGDNDDKAEREILDSQPTYLMTELREAIRAKRHALRKGGAVISGINVLLVIPPEGF